MRVIQLTHSIIPGDGVSNCVCYIQNILNLAGIDNYIYARYADESLCNDRLGEFVNLDELGIQDEDIIIYHMYTDTLLNVQVERLNNKKILIYNNNTEPILYRDTDRMTMKQCLAGILDAGQTRGRYLCAIVPSQFNKQCLVDMGWDEKSVEVIPGIVIKDNQQQVPCSYNNEDGDVTTMLFVGRVTPNKKFEDIIDVFAHYGKEYNEKCQLIFAGNIIYKNYYDALCKYIQEKHIDNVIFKGKVSDEELINIYNKADVFLCMSEHEGFGMPIIEAMQHNIPVVAYDSTAVRETVSDGGILLDNKEASVWCEYIYRLKHDVEYRNQIIDRQNVHVKELRGDDFAVKFIRILESVDKVAEYNYRASVQNRLNINTENEDNILSERAIDKIKKFGEHSTVVIYGMGRIGHRLANEIAARKELSDINIVYCDNKAQNRLVPIITQEQCIREYPDAEYIITAQLYILEIAFDLAEKGVKKEHIHYLNKDQKEII